MMFYITQSEIKEIGGNSPPYGGVISATTK